jgi:TPR repeat protein
MRAIIVAVALLACVGCAPNTAEQPPTSQQLAAPNQQLMEKGAAAYTLERYREAFAYFFAAAERGDALGQAMIASMYAAGHGVARDYGRAAVWARRSADAGNAQGQVMMAILTTEGSGVPRNPVEAYMWATLAINGGGGRPAVEARDRVASRMTPQQIADGQRLAREWRRR